jgi:hypothetical protein
VTPLFVGCLLAVDRAGDGLHGDTSPEAIRAAQIKAVARAVWRRPHATAAHLSRLVVLPVGVVVRRLAELSEGWR